MNVLPTHQPRPIKVAFLTPSLSGGGAERWIVSLAQQFQRGSCCEPVGLAVVHAEGIDRSLEQQARGCMPVHLAAESSAAEASRRACERASVLISWGCPQLGALAKDAGLDLPVVEVAHSTCDLPGQTSLVGASMRGANYWTAVSETAATSYPEADRPRVAVLANGADLNRLQPKLGRAAYRKNWALEEDQVAIVSIGRINPTKRPELLAAALAHLPENYRLIFAGPNQQGAQEKATEYARLFARGRVSFAPVHEHLGDLLALADVFATASQVEAHSLALNEAWLAGVPSVACRIPIVDEFCRRHGQMVFACPRDPTAKELAQAIERAAAAGRAHPCVRHASQVAHAHYTLAAMAGRWEIFLRQIVIDWLDHALYPPLNLVA